MLASDAFRQQARRADTDLTRQRALPMNDALVGAADSRIVQRCWRDFRVLAVDGSTARLPNTPASRSTSAGARQQRTAMLAPNAARVR